MSSAAIYRKVIRRGLVLVLLGCIYNGLLDFDFAHLRYASVLGRIGLSWMFAALLFLNVRTRVRMGVVALLLSVTGRCWPVSGAGWQWRSFFHGRESGRLCRPDVFAGTVVFGNS